MPFEILSINSGSKRAGCYASISLSKRSEDARPVCYIGIPRDMADKAHLVPNDTYQVQLGNGDDAGRLRLLRKDGPGTIPLRNNGGSRVLILGHIPQFGDDRQPKEYCILRILARGSVEIDLPPWAGGVARADAPVGEAEHENDDAELVVESVSESRPFAAEQAGVAAAMAEPAAAASAPVAPESAPEPPDPTDIVAFASDRFGKISYRGKAVEVGPRGARLISALRAAVPNPVAEGFLYRKVLDGEKNKPGSMLKMVRTDTNIAINPIGLDIRVVEGVGLQLVKLGG